MKLLRFVTVFLCAVFFTFSSIVSVGCTKKPSQDELSRLEEAKTAAEGAEKKLGELKQDRMHLESELQAKQAELKKSEDERDEIKQKTGK